jgi:hypothetical protein
MKSSVGISAGLDMTADRDRQAEDFHGQAAENKGGARGVGWEEYERGDA